MSVQIPFNIWVYCGGFQSQVEIAIAWLVRVPIHFIEVGMIDDEAANVVGGVQTQRLEIAVR